jgi:hypothetical protein
VQGKGILPDIVEKGPEQQAADVMTSKNAPALQSRDAEVQLALRTLLSEVHGGSAPGHMVRTVAQNLPAALAGDDMLP